MTGLHVWLRAETHPGERRTPLAPAAAAALIASGAAVTVEASPARCHPIADYRAAGARIAPPGSWADAPADACILGIKSLPDGDDPIRGRHLYFAHAYKGQSGAGALLARFARGGGEILDLEHLTDERGRRLAAFGHWAGYVGAALAIRHWNGDLVPPLEPTTKDQLDRTLRPPTAAPRVLIVGALGRCGRGARAALERIGVEPTLWDVAETARLDRRAILDHDILVNAVGLTEPGPVLLAPEHLDGAGRLSLIVDVTCDVGSPAHLLPVYDRLTGWQHPVRAIADGPAVIAIDNLPSLLPREASDDFSAQLAPHLPHLPDGDAWERSRRAYRTALRDEELDRV
ncbi:saccharopine dehydrogenase [Glycomyces harbinensis]|uniref:Saccharopine dehydrogenase [NAD(+), L-lysine-forming] n=1 Tax=Glycomyces harbinensis TaxID=58114 RepID=A0A1G6ZK17_9ACTN|nr:saccharopine dehydrogenase [Glycomyces harbinensis]SDE02890.1 saccharopine dehydrogenase (NAD+, L-lysine forming) [Glycomyces harbinensis]